MALKDYKIKKIMFIILWIFLGAGAIFLLGASANKENNTVCNGVNIDISGVSNHYFIDKDDVSRIIAANSGNITGRPLKNFNLHRMEEALKKEIWIKDVEMFFDNNNVLQAIIDEREPVARIFTREGNTYYIDSSLMILPLSDKFSARLPVFTGFPSEAKVLSRPDSSLLKNIRDISLVINSDPFLMGMIEQTDIIPHHRFEMIPKIGSQIIYFGDARDYENKFKKLKLFYSQVMIKTGWSRYSVINLQYKDQVVGKIRGKEDVAADSLRTVQLMALIAENAEKMSEDSARIFSIEADKLSADSSMVSRSVEREEGFSQTAENSNPAIEIPEPATQLQKIISVSPVKPNTGNPAKEPVVKKKETVKTQQVKKDPVIKPLVKKNVQKQPAKEIKKKEPKAVMNKTPDPVNNDY